MIANFRQLECFLSLARTLNFSQTGADLRIAQPAVSKYIKQLEEELGVQLFLRTKKTVSLSLKGKELYKEVHPFYEGLTTKLDNFVLDSNNLRGQLNIGCLHEVGEKIFQPLISEFKALNPETLLNLKYLKSLEIVKAVKEGDLHLGIVSEKVLEENVRTYKIYDEEVVLIRGKKTGPLKGKLSEQSYVSYREGDPLLKYYLKKSMPGLQMAKISTPIIVNSHKSIVDFVKVHPYYAVLPKHSVDEALKKKEIVIESRKPLISSLYLIHREMGIKDQKVESMRDFLKQKLKNK